LAEIIIQSAALNAFCRRSIAPIFAVEAANKLAASALI